MRNLLIYSDPELTNSAKQVGEIISLIIAGSSNGRTTDSGSVNLGSSPSPAANNFKTLLGFKIIFYWAIARALSLNYDDSALAGEEAIPSGNSFEPWLPSASAKTGAKPLFLFSPIFVFGKTRRKIDKNRGKGVKLKKRCKTKLNNTN